MTSSTRVISVGGPPYLEHLRKTWDLQWPLLSAGPRRRRPLCMGNSCSQRFHEMPDIMMTVYLLLLPQAPTCEAQLEITVNPTVSTKIYARVQNSILCLLRAIELLSWLWCLQSSNFSSISLLCLVTSFLT